jgi:hypothetical protein
MGLGNVGREALTGIWMDDGWKGTNCYAFEKQHK